MSGIVFPTDQFAKSEFTNYQVAIQSVSLLKTIGAIDELMVPILFDKINQWLFSKEHVRLAEQRIKSCKKALSFEKDSKKRAYLQKCLSKARKGFKVLQIEKQIVEQFFEQLKEELKEKKG